MTDPSDRHECPCGCGARLPHKVLACRPAWRALPGRLRYAVTRAWDSGHGDGTAAHRAAVADAVEHLQAHTAGRTRPSGRRPPGHEPARDDS